MDTKPADTDLLLVEKYAPATVDEFLVNIHVCEAGKEDGSLENFILSENVTRYESLPDELYHRRLNPISCAIKKIS